MVHIWGALGSIGGPHYRVNKWSTSFRSIKIVISEDFSETSFQRGVQSFRCFLVLWSKNRLFKKGVANYAFCNCLFWWLLLHVKTRL